VRRRPGQDNLTAQLHALRGDRNEDNVAIEAEYIYGSANDTRVDEWLRNIPTERPQSRVSSEISHRSNLLIDPSVGAQVAGRAGSTISIRSQMSHISI
jgi:hypothetical protein